MQKLIINCATGEKEYIELSEAEERQRLNRTTKAKKRWAEREGKENKRAEAIERLRADPKMTDVVEALGLTVN